MSQANPEAASVHCVTCADEALPMRVAGPVVDGVCECVDADGNSSDVIVDLVEGVASGSRLLVHAGVAIATLDEMGTP